MSRIYFADAMSVVGPPTFNFPAFEHHARQLRALGHDVIVPNEIDEFEGWVDVERTTGGEIISVTPADKYSYEAILARDLEYVATCDAIVLGPDAHRSPGAQRELAKATELGLTVYARISDVPQAGPFLRFHRATPAPATLIGLTGYAQSGKDTTAGFMAEAGFQRLAFADALKKLAYETSPLVAGPLLAHDDDPWGPWDLSTLIDREGWETAKASAPNFSHNTRTLLQNLGVAVRNVIGDDTWVRLVLDAVQPGGRFVITDVRFPNEVAAIKAAGGTIVRVNRPGTGPVNAHVSESFDGSEADYLLGNTGGLGDLEVNAMRMLLDLGII